MLIDTHAHLYLPKFHEDIDKVIERALYNEVSHIFLPNIDSTSVNDMENLVAKNGELFYPMYGLHPCSVKEDYKNELKIQENKLKDKKSYGVGETGVDLYWDKSFKKQQIDAFETQIQWAIDYDLPVIIHSRESLDLTIDIIQNHQNGDLKGIFHCFNGNANQARRVLDANFYAGLGGVITYKNAGLDETINYLPMSQIVLETDAPYLSPVPYRGKRNESSYLKVIAQKVAEVKNLGLAEVEYHTTSNAKNLFGI